MDPWDKLKKLGIMADSVPVFMSIYNFFEKQLGWSMLASLISAILVAIFSIPLIIGIIILIVKGIMHSIEYGTEDRGYKLRKRKKDQEKNKEGE